MFQSCNQRKGVKGSCKESFDFSAQFLNSFVRYGVGGLGFDSRAGQIGLSAANDLLPLRRFFVAVLPRRSVVEMDFTTRYTTRHSTVPRV